MQIELDRTRREPLYQQLARHIQQRIRNGALPSGTRLPTVRQLAQQLGVTRLTVHSAYAELQSGGWIEATVGRGTFVAERIDALVAPPEATLGREVTPAGVITDILHMTQFPGLVGLAKADPAAEFFPARNWQRASEQALAGGGTLLLGYTTAQGDLPLRAAVAELVRERGVSAGPDEIIVTAGVTQGMALATDILAWPGATVLVEQPTYLGLLNILAARGIRAVGLPIDEEGLVVDTVAQAVQIHQPVFLYTVPSFHNPCGVCMSPRRREALLELAERHNLWIIEDDIYGHMCYEGASPPALKSNDRSGRVIYLSSFSKCLMPGLRIGYAIAAPDFVRRMALVRQASDLCSPPLTQRALAIFLEEGWLHSHIKRMLPRYHERRDALLHAMKRFFPSDVAWTWPRGGFACWVKLPSGSSVTDLYLRAIARGVAFAPGEVFKAEASNQSHLRLCFGAEPPERIAEAIAVLGSLLREHQAHQPHPPTKLHEYVPLV
ncbi:MAG: PLP-dependent aminotransferase family protein [Chloroflexales bacterium]|nr:PLP-dependent aminotransferase family protein [Chloroflexales bacterium]